MFPWLIQKSMLKKITIIVNQIQYLFYTELKLLIFLRLYAARLSSFQKPWMPDILDILHDLLMVEILMK